MPRQYGLNNGKSVILSTLYLQEEEHAAEEKKEEKEEEEKMPDYDDDTKALIAGMKTPDAFMHTGENSVIH